MPTLSSKPPFTNYPVGAAAATTLLFLFFAVGISTVLASNHHVINFRSPNLFPEGLAWDPTAQHFLVGSLRHRTISAVSDAGVVETLISDPSLPENIILVSQEMIPKLLSERRLCKLSGTTDQNGFFEANLFHRDYEMEISHPAMKNYTCSFNSRSLLTTMSVLATPLKLQQSL
ncbi:hypothetical protein glysoja_036970 [Glycine soja]|uniref:Uncharacterized protein n=1 Tax=Glycine soja TaxID=3848 RepID=A0A0B2RVE1_GLYSO|nr:hypothetical protein glysoja_036970 [Glycine soja]